MGIDALSNLGSTSLDAEGARNEDTVQALLPKGTATAGKSSPTGIPIPGTPFKVADVTILAKGRIREEFQAVLPDNSSRLTTIIVPTALRDTDAHYKASMLTDTVKIDQNLLSLNGGLVLYLFGPLVESNTQYDLVQLSVEADTADGGSGTVSNPVDLPAFNDPPLAQFTSGSVVGGPSDPAANLIVINRLDPRSKKFDAEMAFRVYAPLDAAGAARDWKTFLGATVTAVCDFGAGAEHSVQYVIGASDTLTDPASPTVANRGYVDIPRKKLTPGVAGTWIKNIVNLDGEKSVSNSTNIAFFTGAVNQSIQNLTLVNLVAQATGPNDPKHERLILEYQQPSPTAVALKNVTIEMKEVSEADSAYRVRVHKFSLKEDDWITPGQLYSAANGLGIVLRDSLKMKPGTTYVFRMTLKAINDIIYYAVLPSTLPTFTITAGADPDIPADTEVPGGTGAVLTAPTCSFEDGKLAIDFNVTGLTFMNSHLYNSVRLATLSETVPTFTITNAPNTASPTVITTSAPHGYSVGQTVVISGVTGNTAVNGTWVILTVPSTTTFRIGVAGSGAYISGGTVTLPGAFLDIPTKTLVASGTTTKYQVHKSGHVILGLKLRKIRDIFGPTAHIAVRYFITNQIGESPSAIADVNLATLTDLSSETGLEPGTGIPAKTLGFSGINVTPGSAFIASKDAYDGLGDTDSVGLEWRDKPNRTGGGGVRIKASASTRGLKWVKATHWIEIAVNVFTLGGELSCWIPIRPFLPGDSWAEGISLKTVSGSYTLNAFTLSLYDEGNAADIPGTPILIRATDPQPIILVSTAYTVVGAVFTVSDSYVPGTSPRRQWLRLKFGEDPPVVLHADNNMLNRGAQVLPWGPALEDAGIASDIDPSGSTGSGAAGSGGGGGNGSGGGATGGGVGGGEGGRIVL